MKTKFKIMQFIFCLFLAAISITSCTPQKRLTRLVALHPELTTTDTIRIQDTTIIPATRIDTAFHESKLNDTVIITKEKLIVKLHRVKDTVYVEAEREADTVVVEKEVAVERVVNKMPENDEFKIISHLFNLYKSRWIIFFILGILFIVLVNRANTK